MSNFSDDIHQRVQAYASNAKLQRLAQIVLDEMNFKKYAYNFHWLGLPIIQIPQDTVTLQELIWETKPDCIIETGIAHGGSLIFSASMLAILKSCQYIDDPVVIGIDIEIREDNKQMIVSHPLSRYIRMLEGSSTNSMIVQQVCEIAKDHKRIMVFLDSNHTHEHVYQELLAYAPLVSTQSFCVVLDTGIEDIDPTAVADGRPWCKGNSPKSALNDFLKQDSRFILDDYYHEKAVITSFPGGIIRRIG